MATHAAAVSLSKDDPLTLQTRTTPRPGPHELLIAVKAVALNPADTLMRRDGILVERYPTILGFDLAGLVLEVGESIPGGSRAQAGSSDAEVSVSSGAVAPPRFLPGITRVVTYGAAVWKDNDPNYGVFQERCLVPWQHAALVPEEKSISWPQAATLPVSVQVALHAWEALGLPLTTPGPPAGDAAAAAAAPVGESTALLVWGASSSVGTMGVQTAVRLREERGDSCIKAIYATAGTVNHPYVTWLGADRVFDYKSPTVVDEVVSAVSRDGLVIRHCFLANGNMQDCQAVLAKFVQTGKNGVRINSDSRIASAPVIPPDTKSVDGIRSIFLMPSLETDVRLAQFERWMTWLSEHIADDSIQPSPPPRVVGSGLEAINGGLDLLLQGVSCEKLVIELP